jgi:hypothetical protein
MSRLTTIPGEPRRHTAGHQMHIAEAEVVLKGWRILQPWVCGILAFGLATLLHFVFGGTGTLIMVAAAGLMIAFVDAHLRSTRKYLIAKLIGPVAALATTAGMVWLIAYGFSHLLLKSWLIGGGSLAVIWDVWMMSGHHKDDARMFGEVAHAAGMPGMRFIQDRKPKTGRKNAAAERTIPLPVVSGGVLQFPAGMTMDDVTKALGSLEAASGSPRGSWTVSPRKGESHRADVSISNPELLDEGPLDWPGPSAEGESVAVPVRPALMQNGIPLAYDLRNHHALAMGMVGSGKTMGWCYNLLADAFTRRDFACVAADLNKQRQFLGAMEPALHHLATTDNDVLNMMTGLSRISAARSDYMAKLGLTEWQEGCGLCFLDIWLEEAADVIDLITSEGHLADFKSLVRGFRSRGMRLDMSTQRSDFEEIPTFLRSQLARVCFGVENADDAKFGLTTRQRKGGAVPEEWQARYPGKFYIDAPTIPVELITTPMRAWYWGANAQRMADYAVTWPASDRPMDDVTGEAWEARPGQAASAAFPLKTGSKPSARPRPAPVTPPKLHVVKPGETVPAQPRYAGRKTPANQARDAIKAQIEDWRCEGRLSFARRDIDPMVVRMGYSPAWGHGVIGELETAGVLRKCTDKRPAYWEIVAQADANETDGL